MTISHVPRADGSSYSIYCDESCHLEHDRSPVMVLGCVWCPTSQIRRISRDILRIKLKHSATGELKWTKVSASRREFYLELLDRFLEDHSLRFRALVVTEKERLDHDYFNQGSHDTFYYKMYFYLLRQVLTPPNTYRVYLDIKDTRSAQKVRGLRDVLCNNVYDFDRATIPNIQNICSRESALMQLADFLIGAVGYVHRLGMANRTKHEVAQALCRKVGYNLRSSTPPWAAKFNLFVFTPAKVS